MCVRTCVCVWAGSTRELTFAFLRQLYYVNESSLFVHYVC